MEYLQDIFFANLNVVCRAGGFFRATDEARWENGYHMFEQNKFYYITSGECCITINDKEYRAREGMWFFIPAGTKHRYYKYEDKNFEKFWMHFDVYPDVKIFDILSLKHYVVVGASKEPYKLFAHYADIAKSDKLIDKIECKALLLKLIGEYIRLSDAGEALIKGESEETLVSLLAYINENLSGSLANTDMARICHMHPTHFIRYFKNKTGQTPQAYVMQKRMENAKRLLEQPETPISKIAEQVGMCDSAHLSKAFKRFYSASPKQYRKNMYIEKM